MATQNADSKDAMTNEEMTTPMDSSPSPPEKDPGHLTGVKLIMTMTSLTFVVFLMFLDVSVVSTAIPQISSEFHSLNDVGWYGATYVLATSALQPLTGKIYGEFNIKWTFIIFFGIFELGSAICGAAQSSSMFIIGRAIAGMGASGLMNGGYGILHAIVPLSRQPFLLGIVLGIGQIGILCGPLIGGALTEYASWRWCFYINLPCGIPATALLLFIRVADTRTSEHGALLSRIRKLDLLGFFFFAPAAIQLLLALQWGGTKYSWSSATVIGLFCGSAATLVVFIAWEHRMGDNALIPLSIIKRRVIWSSSLNFGFFMGALLITTYYLPIYFQAVRNASPTTSGVDMLPSVISTLFFTFGSGILVRRIGYYLPFAVISAILVIIGNGLSSTLTPTSSIGAWIGFQILLGGRGIGFQIPIIAVQNNSSKEEIAIVNALVVFAQNLGGAIFLSLAEVIFSNSLTHYLSVYAPEVDPETIIVAGANGFRTAISKASLPGVVMAYSKSFDRVMYLGAGASGGALIFSLGMGWMSIKTKATEKDLETSITDKEIA